MAWHYWGDTKAFWAQIGAVLGLGPGVPAGWLHRVGRGEAVEDGFEDQLPGSNTGGGDWAREATLSHHLAPNNSRIQHYDRFDIRGTRRSEHTKSSICPHMQVEAVA